MKRVVVVVMLAVLGGLYLYSAFARGQSRRYRPLPFAVSSVRRVIQAFLGIALLLVVLLVVYGALLSISAEN